MLAPRVGAMLGRVGASKSRSKAPSNFSEPEMRWVLIEYVRIFHFRAPWGIRRNSNVAFTQTHVKGSFFHLHGFGHVIYCRICTKGNINSTCCFWVEWVAFQQYLVLLLYLSSVVEGRPARWQPRIPGLQQSLQWSAHIHKDLCPLLRRLSNQCPMALAAESLCKSGSQTWVCIRIICRK